MRTIAQVTSEIENLVAENSKYLKSNDPKEKKLYKRAQKKIAELKNIKLYLETNPRQEFVESELQRFEKRLESITEGYPEYVESNGFKNCPETLKRYEKERCKSDVKASIKALKSILYS